MLGNYDFKNAPPFNDLWIIVKRYGSIVKMHSQSLKGMEIIKLYKHIKISEASAASEIRFLMRCTVSGVHLTGGMLPRDNNRNVWNALHEARPY